MGEEYLTVNELCAWLKISKSTVDRWKKAGLPYFKHDKLIRFDKQKVQEWLDSKTQN